MFKRKPCTLHMYLLHSGIQLPSDHKLCTVEVYAEPLERSRVRVNPPRPLHGNRPFFQDYLPPVQYFLFPFHIRLLLGHPFFLLQVSSLKNLLHVPVFGRLERHLRLTLSSLQYFISTYQRKNELRSWTFIILWNRVNHHRLSSRKDTNELDLIKSRHIFMLSISVERM